jgi:hypothetical protein
VERHVANRLGDGEVDPSDDAMVDLCPLDAVELCLGVHGAVDMIQESELCGKLVRTGNSRKRSWHRGGQGFPAHGDGC